MYKHSLEIVGGNSELSPHVGGSLLYLAYWELVIQYMSFISTDWPTDRLTDWSTSGNFSFQYYRSRADSVDQWIKTALLLVTFLSGLERIVHVASHRRTTAGWRHFQLYLSSKWQYKKRFWHWHLKSDIYLSVTRCILFNSCLEINWLCGISEGII